MGVSDIVNTTIAFESDKGKRRFLTNSAKIKKRLDCLFESVQALAEQRAFCCIHCTAEGCPVHQARIDFATLGPPCTPYTRRSGQKVRNAKNHPHFRTLWGPTMDWLASDNAPRGGWLEQVGGFDHKDEDN